MTYAARNITLTFQLGTGSFGTSGQNQLTLTGLRVVFHAESVLNNVLSAGGLQCVMRIYGMTLSQMNQLTKAGLQWQQRLLNMVAVQAGDAQSGMTTVFNGNIVSAYPEFSEVPNSAFVVVGITGQGIALKPVPPTSFAGPTDAATAMGSLARAAGLAFENNGVSVKLAYPYFSGTLMQQIAACAKAANCYAHVDGASNTLAVWPKTGSRAGTPPVVSAANGMILYPMFEQNRVVVRTTFDPSIKFGGQVQIQTDAPAVLTAANGTWTVVHLSYDLASQMPAGPWEQTLTCVNSAAGVQS